MTVPASAALLAASLAAGVAEGAAVLSHLQDNETESGGGEPGGGGGGREGVSLILPSLAYGTAALPLSAVGGSPGPAFLSAISPRGQLLHTAPSSVFPTTTRAPSAADDTASDPAPYSVPSAAIAMRDERSGPVLLGGGRRDGSPASFEDAVPVGTNRRGTRLLRRAPNLEPGPHSPRAELLPSPGDVRNMAFDASQASMRSPSSVAGHGSNADDGAVATERRGRFRRPRRQQTPSPTPSEEGEEPLSLLAGVQPLGIGGISRPMRQRAEEMRAARRSWDPAGDDGAPPATLSPAASTAAARASPSAKRPLSSTAGGVLSRYVSSLDGRPLSGPPSAEALRRLRVGLVWAAAAAAVAGYEASTRAEAAEVAAAAARDRECKEDQRRVDNLGGRGEVERYLLSGAVRERAEGAGSGTALRLVPRLDTYPGGELRRASPIVTLPIVCPDGARPAYGRDDRSVPHWMMGSAPGGEGDWTDAPVSPQWLFRPSVGGGDDCGGSRRPVPLLLVEADVSTSIREYVSAAGRRDVGADSGERLTPEAVRLAAQCLAAAAWRNGVFRSATEDEEGERDGGRDEVVRVVVGSGPPSRKVDGEAGVVYVNGLAVAAAELIHTLEEMHHNAGSVAAVATLDSDDVRESLEAGIAKDDGEKGSRGRGMKQSETSATGALSLEEGAAASTATTVAAEPLDFVSDPLGTVGSVVRRAGGAVAGGAASTLGTAGAAVGGVVNAAVRVVDTMGSSVRRSLGGGGLFGRWQERRKVVRLCADEATAQWIRPSLTREGWTVTHVSVDALYDLAAGEGKNRQSDDNDDGSFVLVACPTDDETLDAVCSLLATGHSVHSSTGGSRGRLAVLLETESSVRTLQALLGESKTDGDEATSKDRVRIVCTAEVKEEAFLRVRELLARGGTTEEVQRQVIGVESRQ